MPKTTATDYSQKTTGATDYSHTLYNSLPLIEVANRLFTNREDILPRLAQLLLNYPKFGVCIVHRHCVLEEGERMVTRGNVSQPEYGEDNYPERWLASGIPYEFSREKTADPPEKLLEKFRAIVGDIDVLGIFYVQDGELGGVALERTEGRANIVTIVQGSDLGNSITTAWLANGMISGAMTRLYECSACSVSNNSHVENVAKMEGLERNRDLGHEIGWLEFTTGDVKIHCL